jgi:uncharacterized membrane protein
MNQPGLRMGRVPLLLTAAWVVIYTAILVLNHLTLRTNAYDLSVFDYALWSTTHGPRPGFVPFFGHTLQAHHMMPTLWLLWPVHALVPSPWLLIALQVGAFAAAALYFARASARRLSPGVASALIFAFLFSRRSHSATTSVFYIECLEPILIFGLVWASASGRWSLYWGLLIVALGCQENMALYTAGYGAVLMFTPATRRVGLITVVLSIAWVLIAVRIVIPWARAADGLPPAYAFITERYGDQPVREAIARLLRWESIGRVFTLTATTGLICWLRPRWLLPIAPGVLLNLAAKDEALQSGLVGHYLWPILPFLFLAALEGARHAEERWPRAARVWALVLVLIVIADSPVARPSFLTSRLNDAAVARDIRAALRTIPPDQSVLSQPQLVPHISKRPQLETVASAISPASARTDWIVLSPIGDQWPLRPGEYQAIVSALDVDPEYTRLGSTPAVAMFSRRR